MFSELIFHAVFSTGFFVTRLLAAFFADVFAAFLLPLCFLTVFVARDFLATAFFAAFLTASFFAFFAFLAPLVAFLVFAGISATPQVDDFLSEDLTINRRRWHLD